MTNEDGRRPFRVAIREEGRMVNAYWAKTGTMDGAELVASISVDLCRAEPFVFASFKALMAAIAEALIVERLGVPVERVEVTPAPESERSGHG